jgi:predicted PurR-regulated permease PerM
MKRKAMRLELDRTLKILLTIVLAAVVGYFAWQLIQHVLYPIELFVMGAILAFILSPLVDRLHKRAIPRPLAILLVYAMLLSAASLLGYLLVNPLLNQIQELVGHLPDRVTELQQRLNGLHIDAFLQKYKLPTSQELARQAGGYLQNLGQTIFDNLTGLVYTSFNFVVNLVLILVIAFYLLLDGERLKERLYFLVPESQLGRVTFVEATVNEVLGGYLRGQLLMALTIGTMAGAGTAVLQVQYPAVIGVLAGILELVPMLGPWLASMPAVAIAIFSPHPWPQTLWVAIYFLVIQQLEANVIGPRITGHAVGLHPLAALMALLVGIELAGILGALFAVPVAGILYVLGLAIYYNVSGRDRPIPQPRPTKPSLLSTLNHRIGWRKGHPLQNGAAARFAAMRLRREQTQPVPARLELVERAADKLLDKRQQKHPEPDSSVPACPEEPAVPEIPTDATESAPSRQKRIPTAAR